MTTARIQQEIDLIFRDELNVSAIAPYETLDSLGADSFDKVEISMRLEERFGINIPDEDITKIQSVRDATYYVNKRVNP